MQLGTYSLSLTVKDIQTSKEIWEKLASKYSVVIFPKTCA